MTMTVVKKAPELSYILQQNMKLGCECVSSLTKSFSFLLKAMEGSMLTISLGIWMELPGVNYRDLTLGKRRYVLCITTVYFMKTF